jgi:hypothetical protein
MLRVGRAIPGGKLVRASILRPWLHKPSPSTGGLYRGCVRALTSVEAELGARRAGDLRLGVARGSIEAVRVGFQGRRRRAGRLKAFLTLELRELATVTWRSGRHGLAVGARGLG